VKKIDLPGEDNWAKLRDPEEVPEKLRRPLLALQRRSLVALGEELVSIEGRQPTAAEAWRSLKARVDSGELELEEQIEDRIVVAFVADWSYELPVTPESVGELPAGVVKALRKACEPLIGPLLGETTDDDVLDPQSPTVPANGSDKP